MKAAKINGCHKQSQQRSRVVNRAAGCRAPKINGVKRRPELSLCRANPHMCGLQGGSPGRRKLSPGTKAHILPLSAMWPMAQALEVVGWQNSRIMFLSC